MTRALMLICLLLLVAGTAHPQDGLWFCNYQTGNPGITRYAFDGTRLVDVGLPGSICYAAAVDYARDVWVTTSSSQALKIDSSGQIQVTTSTGTSPQGVAVDGFDNLFVVSRGARTVTKFDPFGKAVATGQTPKGCLSCIVDAQGQVYVPVFDLGSNVPFELYRYDNNLQNMVTITFTPNSTSTFGLSGIACDVSGDLYVANQARSSVMKILSTGTVGWETPVPAYARGMAVDVQGHVWAAGHAGRAVFKLRAGDGALLSTFNTPGSSPLCGVLVDANSDVWSLGNVSPVINKWDRAGGVNLVQRNERAGSTVAMGESSGYHSAVILHGSQDYDGDFVDNLSEALAGSSFLDQFTTPTRPTPIVSGDLSGGSNLYLGVRHLASAGMNYAVGLSFGTTPGIPIPGVGTIPLNLDNLLIISLQLGAPLFNNMLGGLDGQGDGLAWVQMPSGLPSNITMYAAFVTFDAGGIRVISNPVILVTP
jgi:streptogramin lyase